MEFKNFIGNKKVKEQISNLIESGRLPQVILLEGEDGLGKRTFAREIAMALFCKNREGDIPCHECSQCIKVQKHEHPDVYEYSPSGALRSFHIDKVRDIITDVYMPPNEAEYKIYILGNIHCMNESAQNAALKVLEEPPSYVIFILTTRSKSMLLPTVLSRATTFSIFPVDEKDAALYISENNDGISYDKALEAVSAEHGNIGRALNSLLDAKSANYVDFIRNAVIAMQNGDEYAFLCGINKFKDRTEIISLLQLFKMLFRDALLTKKNSEVLVSDLKSSSSILSKHYTARKLMGLVEATDGLIEMADKNANISLITTEISLTFFRAIDR